MVPLLRNGLGSVPERSTFWFRLGVDDWFRVSSSSTPTGDPTVLSVLRTPEKKTSLVPPSSLYLSGGVFRSVLTVDLDV